MPCRMMGDGVQATMPCHMQCPAQKEKHPQAEELRKAGRCALLQYLRSVRIAHEQSIGATKIETPTTGRSSLNI